MPLKHFAESNFTVVMCSLANADASMSGAREIQTAACACLRLLSCRKTTEIKKCFGGNLHSFFGGLLATFAATQHLPRGDTFGVGDDAFRYPSVAPMDDAAVGILLDAYDMHYHVARAVASLGLNHYAALFRQNEPDEKSASVTCWRFAAPHLSSKRENSDRCGACVDPCWARLLQEASKRRTADAAKALLGGS